MTDLPQKRRVANRLSKDGLAIARLLLLVGAGYYGKSRMAGPGIGVVTNDFESNPFSGERNRLALGSTSQPIAFRADDLGGNP